MERTDFEVLLLVSSTRIGISEGFEPAHDLHTT